MAERRITLPPHLWELLDVMAADAGVNPEALVNLAVFGWAREHGYAVATVPPSLAAASPPSVEVSEPPEQPDPGIGAQPLPSARSQAEAARTAQVVRVRAIADDVARLVKTTIDEPTESVDSDDSDDDDWWQDDELTSSRLDRGSEQEPAWVHTEQPEVALQPQPSLRGSSPTRDLDLTEAGSRVRLTLTISGEEPIEVEDTPFVIGRIEGCDLRISSDLVSRRHAVIERDGAVDYRIVDRDSSNGVWLGGERVSERVLRDGDVVRIGDQELLAKITVV